MIVLGAISFTCIVTVAVPKPPALVAVTVYVAEVEINVGVPYIVPLDEPKDSPVGRVGDIDHVCTAPPLAVGVTDVISESIVNVKELGL
jgi:hypothetical protein